MISEQEKYQSTWNGPDGSRLIIQTYIKQDTEYLKSLFSRILQSLNDDSFVYVEQN